MKRGIFYIFFILLSQVSFSQSYLDYIKIYWTENGQSKSITQYSGATYNINIDHGSNITITIRRKTNAPTPITFMVNDQSNSTYQDITTSNMEVTFKNCVG